MSGAVPCGAARPGRGSPGCGRKAAPPAARLGAPPHPSTLQRHLPSHTPLNKRDQLGHRLSGVGMSPPATATGTPGGQGGYRDEPATRCHHFGQGGPTAGSVPSPPSLPLFVCGHRPARRNNAARRLSAPLRSRLPLPCAPPGPELGEGGDPARRHSGTDAPKVCERAREGRGSVCLYPKRRRDPSPHRAGTQLHAGGGGAPLAPLPACTGTGVRDPPGGGSAAGTAPRHRKTETGRRLPGGAGSVRKTAAAGLSPRSRSRAGETRCERGSRSARWPGLPTRSGARPAPPPPRGHRYRPRRPRRRRRSRRPPPGTSPAAASLPAARSLRPSVRGRLRAAADRRSGSARPPAPRHAAQPPPPGGPALPPRCRPRMGRLGAGVGALGLARALLLLLPPAAAAAARTHPPPPPRALQRNGRAAGNRWARAGGHGEERGG
ncbi:uncharacterized protein LOC115598153 [Calypte anna]|uniref:uncharacterized protein LOC115598153 n=1 Tax=Calypte anna TaxID=9244 RepID=UPI0011C435D8|nr:uncharacterized protein LOC115598153 [Calypte anna]